MDKVRTRFAPSPTGFMHIGNLRTGLYAYLFARKNGGDFVLRIEDTDQARYVDGAVQVIYNTLKTAGIDYDEGPDKDKGFGPYIQSERKSLYLKYALELIERGGAYYCFCDKERLDSLADSNGVRKYDKHCLHLSKAEIEDRLKSGQSYVIRQNIPAEGEGSYVGVLAVIDKDYASECLAEIVDAEYLYILTAVDRVCINFNKPDQKEIKEMSCREAEAYAQQGQFAPGSMLPKVKASMKFAASKTGRKAVICSLEKAALALSGKSGTIVKQ